MITKKITYSEKIKQQILNFVAKFECSAFLDSSSSTVDHVGEFDFLAGISTRNSLILDEESLKKALSNQKNWIFGSFSYEFKNEIFPKKLKSENQELYQANLLNFFEADILILKRKSAQNMEILAENPNGVFEEILNSKPPNSTNNFGKSNHQFIQKDEYLKKVKAIQKLIYDGEVYEVNLTQAFKVEAQIENIAQVFHDLTKISPTPFAGLLRFGNLSLISASPERFLKKKQSQLISQPIKGTISRSENPEIDEKHRIVLENSKKDKAENVMIVDLVRNDLNRSCKTASVKVPYLFEIQQFTNVYQMVSTITGEIREDISALNAIKNAFPPGSMTGAPKLPAIQYIEDLEVVQRGLYSGSLGYFAPNGDFDFNVVIRSLVYDESQKALFYNVGGAITIDSIPENEYEECNWKARAIRKLLERE